MQTTFDEPVNLSEKLSKLLAPVVELEEGLLVSATYDGDKQQRRPEVLRPRSATGSGCWEDNTGHRPYCYTKLPMSDWRLRSRRSDGTGS